MKVPRLHDNPRSLTLFRFLLPALILVMLLPCAAPAFSSAEDEKSQPTLHRFTSEKQDTPLVLSCFGQGPGPEMAGGVLKLLKKAAGEGQNNAVAFPRTASGLHTVWDASFKLRIREGGEGMGLVFLNTGEFGAEGPAPEWEAWEEPNLAKSFAVGFDISNPHNEDWFKGSGNFYDRPQREISLHWNGLEVANRLCAEEFRDFKFHEVRVAIRFVAGGAHVTVAMGKTQVYSEFFIPEMTPYENRVALGARTGELTTSLEVDNLEVIYSQPGSPGPEPVRVRALKGLVVNSKQSLQTAVAALPEAELQVARVILVLTLEEPKGGWDKWDRSAAIYAWTDEGERFEILRYITPYLRKYQWKADVTDFQSILRGECKMGVFTSSWHGNGFKVTVDLHYYPGVPEREAYAVQNLWVGSPNYGSGRKPFGDFYDTRKVSVDRKAKGAKLRFMFTGHGQVGEFTPAPRTVTVGRATFENTLWKTDVYLNPVRPQSGTWKFDRAGWAPGDLVTPWEIDISKQIKPGKKCTIKYTPHPYANGAKGEASHWVESQIVFYGKPAKK